MNPWKLILLGFLRHVLGALGAWLATRGIISPEDKDAWVSSATMEIFGWLLMAGAVAWSAMDKKAVIDWLRKALRMSPKDEQAAAPQISPLVK